MERESSLSGRVVLLTGEGDVAAAVTGRLRSHGARVALAGPAAASAPLAAAPGAPDLALPCGHGDLAELGRAVDTVIESFGRLDHLVHLVGSRPQAGLLMELDPLALRDVLDRALVTPLACVQRAYWRWMAAHGGSVVHVLVHTARRDGPQDTALAGLTELTEWLAAELAPRVDVHAIVPSPSLTPGAYRAGVTDVLCDLLTRRMNPAQGPVLVLSEELTCPSRAA
ncbi:SDR family oxidoreductase [Streptomyces sp. NPDC005202]|uniref:SDR family oxidoreductase n=1 Tax=Streptomyces sp. NPDC005202 TaxID=3157021 RepID=UPI0033B99A43